MSGPDSADDGRRGDTGLDKEGGGGSETLLFNQGELASVTQNLLKGSFLEIVLKVFVTAGAGL
jgi:hypothetical protein